MEFAYGIAVLAILGMIPISKDGIKAVIKALYFLVILGCIITFVYYFFLLGIRL